MPDSTNRGITFPLPGDLVRNPSAAAQLATDMETLARTADSAIGQVDQRVGTLEDVAMQRRPITDLPADVLGWTGEDKIGIYPIPAQITVDGIANGPTGSGLAIVTIAPIATGGNLVTWSEYGGEQRIWQRTVSTTPGRATIWRRIDTPTRRVLHQLTQPGAPTLTDAEPQRHVRLPVRLPATVNAWDLTLKNFNERSGTRFGDLDFTDVYIAPRAVDANGDYTADFAETPVNLGTPSPLGGPTSNGRRFVIENIGYTLEAGREYILSYAYYDPDSSPNHLGIGGSYNGIEPGGVASMSVSNEWSQYTPLDVYLTLRAPETTPTIAFLGSSSETGLHSPYPLRDSWAWRVAESRGAFPVMLGQSGQTLAGLSSGFVWTKVGAMDRVDEAWLCAGSNDVYSGADLATVQGRHGVVADRVRAHLSDRIVGVDVFPRATETAAVRNVRTAYNAWLRELPHGLSAAFDRAAAVSDASGLLKPEYNAGDDTHLNGDGQRVLAGAVLNPASAVTPAYNSGIVEAAGLLSEFTSTTSGVTLQRIGPHCEFTVRARRFDKAGASASTVLCTLPVGYRPSALYRDRLVTHPGTEVDVDPSGTVTLVAGTIAQDSYVTFRLVHLTTDPAPVS